MDTNPNLIRPNLTEDQFVVTSGGHVRFVSTNFEKAAGKFRDAFKPQYRGEVALFRVTTIVSGDQV